MTAIRAQIVAEIARRMALVPGINEVEVMPSTDPDVWPALHLFDDGQEPSEYGAEITRQNFAPRIECYVEQPGGAAAYALLNDIYSAVIASLIDGTQLGGLVETIDEGRMEIDVAPLASAPRLYFRLDLPITFAARRGDPSLPA
ncbi:hypothetical protein [Sphingomonas elodea]|uniref:hypothetical protein n=1 Tax=Sphingomonas elodea TaxID=179878 RepID=UPI0002631E33|nr:hypothetical protein [Sphingomonas elodea]